MNPVKRYLLKAGSIFAGKQTSGVRFLLFHEINDSQMRVFEKIINFIKDHFGFIAPDEYDRYIHSSGVHYIISFDDGFASQLEATREILDPLGIKALFFICPRFAGLQGKDAVDFARGQMRRFDVIQMTPEIQSITWDDLISLSAKGHVIGSHSMNHARLSEVSHEAELIREIVTSGDELEKQLGKSVDWFAYPFGNIDSIDQRAFKVITKRYAYCCSGIRGINTGVTHRLCLARESINLHNLTEESKLIATGALDPAYCFKRKKLIKMVVS